MAPPQEEQQQADDPHQALTSLEGEALEAALRRGRWQRRMGGLARVPGGLLATYWRDIAAVGAGFAAKSLASHLFVGGRQEADVRATELAKLGFLRLRVDPQARSVTARLGPFAPRTAWMIEGRGCVLGQGPEKPALTPRLPPASARPAQVRQAQVRPVQDLGPSTGALQAAVDAILAAEADDPKRHTHALLVTHRGRLAAEAYGPGITAQTRLHGWSITKTVVALLTGILADRGLVDPQGPLGHPYWSGAGRSGGGRMARRWADPRQSITVDHALTMTTGLAFTEATRWPLSDVVSMLFVDGDTAGYTARRPLVHAPGTHFAYTSGTTNLLCHHLDRAAHAAGTSLDALIQDALIAPSGVGSLLIEPDRMGLAVGSSYGWATARDWLLLGQLILQEGALGSRQIVPAPWIRRMGAPDRPDPAWPYGRHAWRGPVHGDPRYTTLMDLPVHLFGSGYQGQGLVVVPSAGLVILRLGVNFTGKGVDLDRVVAPLIAAV